MGFFKNKSDMFNHRAERFKQEGDRHWAAAKNGQGNFHYEKAKKCYDQANENREKAQKFKNQGF